MSAPGLAARQISPDSWIIQGREVRLPLLVRDATSVFATFVVGAAAVRRLIDHPAIRLVEPWPGRAMCSIAAIEYRDNDLGRYNEIAVAFLVRNADSRPIPIVDFLRPRAGAYIHYLPVTTSLSRDAGLGIWGFPKVVAEIGLRDDGPWRTATLHADGEHVLTLRARVGGRFRFADAPLDSFALRDGTLWKTPFRSTCERVGFRVGGANLELGPHAIAEQLRSIGLPKRPLLSGFLGKMAASFGAPQALAGAAKISSEVEQESPDRAM